MQNSETELIINLVWQYFNKMRGTFSVNDMYPSVIYILYGYHKQYMFEKTIRNSIRFISETDELLNDLYLYVESINHHNIDFQLLEFYNTITNISHEKFEIAYPEILSLLNDRISSIGGKVSGEFYTPNEILSLIAYFVNKEACKTIYDPFCGTASIINHLSKDVCFVGQDLNHWSTLLARVVLDASNTNQFTITCTDSLTNWNHRHFDAVIACPPLGVRLSEKQISDLSHNEFNYRTLEDVLFMRSFKDNNANLFIALESLGLTFNSGHYKSLRRFLVENNLLDTIISLPSNLLYGTSISPILIICKRNRKIKAPITFIHAENYFSGENRFKRKFDMHRFLSQYESEETSDIVKVNIENICNNEYNLNPNLYNAEIKLKEGQMAIPLSELITPAEIFREVDHKEIDLVTSSLLSNDFIKVLTNKNKSAHVDDSRQHMLHRCYHSTIYDNLLLVTDSLMSIRYGLRTNDSYSEWCNIMFNGKRLCFEIPVNSRSGFIFKISNNRGYAEIHHYGQGNITIYSPKGYNINQTLYHGIHINEPKLEFINPYVNKPAYDDNPMRGLSKYRPFDANYFDVFPKDVCIGSICPTSYSLKFSEFLKRLNSTVSADKLSDYVHHYTGFSNIYNCRLDIPEIHSEKWVSINDNPKSAINLAKTICTEGQKLSEQFPGIVLLIFVPNSWSNYRQFNYHGETFDLHNYIKAFAAQHRFTTQFIEEKTLYDKMVCEISWWLSLALFVKALRTPWTLADLDQNTAYAGIGYSIKKQYSGKAEVVLGCSHIYNAQGQGLRYKLSKVEHPQFDKKKNPYLNFEEAYKFGMDILALFQDAMEKLPQRVVVHKRTPFKNDEIEGITNALKQAGISEIDLITITQEYDLKFIAEKIMYGQFLEDGYPVDRGTCIKLSSRNALLWTHGVVPSIQSNRRYYQGGRCIPAPLKITKYYGHGDLETIAKEILGFTKMNWNSFNLYTKLPATIDTSNTLAQVGNLLRQYNGVTYDYRFFI